MPNFVLLAAIPVAAYVWTKQSDLCHIISSLATSSDESLHMRLTANILRTTLCAWSNPLDAPHDVAPSAILRWASCLAWIYIAWAVASRLFLTRTTNRAKVRVYTGYEDQLFQYKTVRALGPLEAMMIAGSSYFDVLRLGTVASVTGPLSTETVRNALRVLMAHHGLLRCGVHASGQDGKLHFHEYTRALDKANVVTVHRYHDTQWESEFEKHMNTQGRSYENHDSLLFQLVFLTDGANKHEFIVMASHSIADATAQVAFVSDLLKYCARVNALRQQHATLPELSAAVEALCKAEWREVGRSVDDIYRSAPKFETKIPLWVRCMPGALGTLATVLRGFHQYKKTKPYAWVPVGQREECLMYRKLSPAALSKIITLCKQRGMTVHSALHGMYMKVHQDVLGLPAGKKFGVLTSVRVGNHTSPPIPRSEILTAASAVNIPVTFRAPSSAASAAWEYAKDCQNNLHGDPKTKLPGPAFAELEKYEAYANLMSAQMMVDRSYTNKDACGRSAAALLSNIGDVGALFPKTYGDTGTRLVFESFFFAQTNRTFGEEIQLLLGTFHGEVFLTFNFFTPMYTKDLRERFANEFVILAETL